MKIFQEFSNFEKFPLKWELFHEKLKILLQNSITVDFYEDFSNLPSSGVRPPNPLLGESTSFEY